MVWGQHRKPGWGTFTLPYLWGQADGEGSVTEVKDKLENLKAEGGIHMQQTEIVANTII